MRFHKADWRGDGFYYSREDLEATEENGDCLTPKKGAIPRNRHGKPISECSIDEASEL